MRRIKFVGLDVHVETIAVAVAEQDGEVRLLGVIPNRVESIRKLVRKLGPVEQLQFCYEAGPTGSSWSEPRLYWKAPCDSRSFSRSSLERLSNRLAVTVLETQVLETGDPIRKQLKWKATRLGLRLVQAHAAWRAAQGHQLNSALNSESPISGPTGTQCRPRPKTSQNKP
jgi:hypothetical protein